MLTVSAVPSIVLAFLFGRWQSSRHVLGVLADEADAGSFTVSHVIYETRARVAKEIYQQIPTAFYRGGISLMGVEMSGVFSYDLNA